MQRIGPEKLLLKIASILDKLRIKYFVTGSLAVSVWGRPRSTADIDIVIKLIEPQVEPLAKALRKISQAGYIDEDIARYAIRTKGEFNFIEPDTGLKVDFWVIKEDKVAEVEYRRRMVIKIDSRRIYFISPEDLVLNKLLWYKQTDSNRHLEDIEGILEKSKLDFKYLKRWAKYKGVLRILNKILKKK